MENIKEFRRNDRVKVSSCVAWDIGFRSELARRDIVIPGNAQGYALLTVDLVEDEILRQNGFFVGLDGLGDHATLKIDDPEMYKFLFGCEDKSHHFTKNILTDLLKLSSKNKFTDVMKEHVKTRSEAKMCLYYMADIDWENFHEWKRDTLNQYCRSIAFH